MKGPLMHLGLVHYRFLVSSELGIHFFEQLKGNDSDWVSSPSVSACSVDEFGNTWITSCCNALTWMNDLVLFCFGFWRWYFQQKATQHWEMTCQSSCLAFVNVVSKSHWALSLLHHLPFPTAKVENFPLLLLLVSELYFQICNVTITLKVCSSALINNMLSTNHIFLQLSAGSHWSAYPYICLGLWQGMGSWGLWGCWLEWVGGECETKSVVLTITTLCSLLWSWSWWVWW